MRKGNHMKLEWMGRYREMVQYLIRFSNRYSAIKTKEAMGDDIPYSFEQIQVIEYLLENEELQLNMRGVADRLGVRPSAFTKLVNRLEDRGLLEKYHTTDNQKNIVVTVSEKGKALYSEYCDHVAKFIFHGMFQVGESISDEELEKMTMMMKSLGLYQMEQKEKGKGLIPVRKSESGS